MTPRWLSEHRRLLAATIGPALLLAVALMALGGGSSAAQRNERRPSTAAPLVVSRGQLVAERTQVQQLQTLIFRQSAEISSLRAQLQVRRRPTRHRHHRR